MLVYSCSFPRSPFALSSHAIEAYTYSFNRSFLPPCINCSFALVVRVSKAPPSFLFPPLKAQITILYHSLAAGCKWYTRLPSHCGPTRDDANHILKDGWLGCFFSWGVMRRFVMGKNLFGRGESFFFFVSGMLIWECFLHGDEIFCLLKNA